MSEIQEPDIMTSSDAVSPAPHAASLRGHWLAPTALVVLFVVALALVALDYLSSGGFARALFGADVLQTPAFFEDVLGHGGNPQDWYFAPAPDWFPEFLFFWVAYLIGGSPFIRILIDILLQITFTAIVLYPLARSLRARRPAVLALLATLVILTLAVATNSAITALFKTGYHWGSFTAQILSVAGALWLIRQPSRIAAWWSVLAGLALVAALGGVSDALFLVQFAVPAFVTASAIALLGLVRRRRPSLRGLVVTGVLLAAAIAGYAVYPRVTAHPTRYPAVASLGNVVPNLGVIRTQISDAWHTSSLWVILVALSSLAVAIAVTVLWRRRTLPWGFGALVLFWIVSAACVGASTLLLDTGPSPRYFLAAAIWPIIILVMLLPTLLRSALAITSVSLAGILVACMSIVAVPVVASAGVSSQYYPAYVECIDRATAARGATTGITQYWNAKPLAVLSHNDLVIAQYTRTLHARPERSSAGFFRERYDFALVKTSKDATKANREISIAALTALNGPPSSTARCGQYELYFYSGGLTTGK